MSTAWYQGGDLTPKNQIRQPLKARYRFAPHYYKARSGSDKHGFDVVDGTSRAAVLRQSRLSWGHPYRELGEADFNIGGQFLSLRAEVLGGKRFESSRIYPGSPDFVSDYEGWIYASPDARSVFNAALRSAAQEHSFLAGLVPQESTSNMYSKGATAINLCKPASPLVDLSTSLAELLREGLPSSPGLGGNAGGEYLNYQFGIAPLASDIRDMRRVMKQAEELYAQYARDSGKRVRRRFNFKPEISVSDSKYTNRTVQVAPILKEDGTKQSVSPSGAHVQPGTLFQHTETTTKVWFSGAFTYYLPPSGWMREMDRLDRLYGLIPGVDTLYQLTPWSWLVDYFSNLGDVVENLNSFSAEGLVMPYGYVMAEKTTHIQSTLNFRSWKGDRFEDDQVSDIVKLTSKRRLPAAPFGFGMLDRDLSAKQLSILAALGLSRS